jgi:hypothetical protein
MLIFFFYYVLHRFIGVIVSVLTSSVADNVLKPRSGQTKDYKIDICCFSGKYTTLRCTSKDWLARNQDNVSEWSIYPEIELYEYY